MDSSNAMEMLSKIIQYQLFTINQSPITLQWRE